MPKKKTAPHRRKLPLTGAALAAKQADEGKATQALSWAKSIAAKVDSSRTPDDLLVASQICFKFNEYSAALNCCEQLRALGVVDPEIDNLHRCSTAALGRCAEATAGLELEASEPHDLLRLAHFLEISGGAVLAGEFLRSALDFHPDSVDIQIELARLMGNAGDATAAIDLLSRVLEAGHASDRQRAVAWFFTGIFNEQISAPMERIEAAYRASIGLAPDHPRAYINLALAWDRSRQFARTIELLEPVRERFAQHPKLAYLLASAYRLADEPERAVAILQQLVSISEFGPAWELLGRLLGEQNQPAAAVAHYRRWLAVQPGNAVAEHMLAAIEGEHVPERASARYVADTFDSFAETFEETLQRLEYRGPEYMQRLLLENVGPSTEEGNTATTAASRTVLDAGCGTGLVGPVLRPYAAHLIGVDLSPAMLERAATKGVYDELTCCDLVEHLQQSVAQYDMIVAADTFNYFGELNALLPVALAALKESGWLLFSLEEGPLDGETYHLQPHGRYVHSPAYIIECMGQCGLTSGTMNRTVMRKENDRDVHALLIAVQKP